MSQAKPPTPIERAAELLERYKIAKQTELFEGGSLASALGPRRFAFDLAVELVKVTDQLAVEARFLADALVTVAQESSLDIVSTSGIQFGNLGPKYTVLIALLAERSRLIKTLEAFSKVAPGEQKPDSQ
jgi:hypothetical protein